MFLCQENLKIPRFLPRNYERSQYFYPEIVKNPKIFANFLVGFRFVIAVNSWVSFWSWVWGFRFGLGFCGFSFGFLGLALGFGVKVEFCRVRFGFGVKFWLCGFSFDFLGLILGLGSIFLGFSFLCTLKFHFQFSALG